MWKKTLFIIFLFYLLALLQNSFFTHFNLFGVIPNLVFILFILLVFYSGKDKPSFGWKEILYCATAGFFLDVFSYVYLGTSIILFIIIGFLLKKTQSLLKSKGDERPFVYFVPLFLACFVVYEALVTMGLRFDLKFIVALVYNLLFATLFFFVCKKWQKLIV